MVGYEHLLHPRSSTVQREASFLRRSLAFIIDILLLDIFVTAPFTFALSGLIARIQQDWFSISMTGREMAAVAAIALIMYTYFVLFEYILGQTPGMMLLRTKVQNVRLWQPFVRNSFLLPLFPFTLFLLIEPIAILATRRGLLERLSHTRTLHEKEVLF